MPNPPDKNHSKKIQERSLLKKKQRTETTDISAANLFRFMEVLTEQDQKRQKKFLSPVKDQDGRYVTSKANLDKWIDPRIFRETQLKRFFHFLATTPILSIFFSWLLVKALGMKLAYFDLNEDKTPEKNYKLDEAITSEATASLTVQNLGHATQLVQTPGMNIITDPAFADLAPLVYPSMTKGLGHDVKPEELPRIDVILISHNHRDHVDEYSLKKIKEAAQRAASEGIAQPQLFVPMGDEDYFRSLGFTNVHAFEWHEEMTVTSKTGQKVTFCAEPADHRSGRKGYDSHKSLVVGWTISPKQSKEILYFAGDTAKLNDTRMLSLASDIYQLYQHKTDTAPDALPQIINMEPGGPNYTRRDMKPTHQSAVDALTSSFRLAVALEKVSETHQGSEHAIHADKWLEATATIFMHRNKYQLGPDRFNEDVNIYFRLLSYLQMDEKTLKDHMTKQTKKSPAWSLFNRRKDFILEAVDELKSLAKKVWPDENPEQHKAHLIDFIKARTHFPSIREKLNTDDAFKFKRGETSTYIPDTFVEEKGKHKGEKLIDDGTTPSLRAERSNP